MQGHKIRKALEEELKRPVSDEMWGYLDDRGFIDDVRVGAMDIGTLAAEVRRIERAAASSTSKLSEVAKPDGPAHGQERRWSLSILVAEAMAQEDRVRSFRREHLEDCMIPWSEVEMWIERHRRIPGRGTTSLTITINDDRLLYKPGETGRLDPPLEVLDDGFRLERKILDFALPGDEWVRRVVVNAGGALDQLRQLSEWLAKRCGWQEAQATVFVLAGVTPLIPAVRVTTSALPERTSWNNRVLLDIDPAATVDEVIETFQRFRREHGLMGRRTVPPKLARLAAFAMAQHTDKPWKERLRLWNEEFPQWRYDHSANFRRDAATSMRRVLLTQGR